MKRKFEAVMLYIMLPLYLLAHFVMMCGKFVKRKSKPALALLVTAVMIFSSMPLTAFAAEANDNPYYNRVVDVNTMDNWTKYFDFQHLDTSNAGGVWTDKSVFTDASAFPESVNMINDDENFLTALSALAANKEVVGYSTIPTDTVLVLDLSGSMKNSDSEEDLIDAANDAIAKLLAVNDNNRVGVVLYSASDETGSSTYDESVTRILPIDRYTTDRDGIYLRLSNNGNVSVDGDVEGTVANADLDNSKSFGGGTYIQAGLWEAMKMFKEKDTVIGENNWQSGDNRMPILVLMSDGAPSTGTSYYADVENSNYTYTQRVNNNGQRPNQRPQYETVTVEESNVGNGNEQNLTAGNAFLTQLTASYVMNQIEEHYQKENSDVRGLFYTLGFNIGTNNVAQSVMNPDNSTYTDSLWNTYNRLNDGNMSVRVKDRTGDSSDVSITKNSYATSKSYVDEYFSASGDGLTEAFDSIVEEIILQSRYYPTHLEGGSPDFSGYVEFEDTLGEYMEVKDIKGILLGDILYDGHMMASKFANNSSDGLGTVENPTELGDEFIRAVKTRLGIAETVTAQVLVAEAFAAGQLKYNSATDWSNYIGWYAKADGTYVGFWDENSNAASPTDAVYKIKSYGFLGETKGSIKNSDMMYMSVQVRTNIATGQQTLLWKIPAALVPMVTYLISLEGTNVEEARNVEISVENADDVSPVRLVFESGLRSDLNELNIASITDSKHIAADGVTRQFWTNYFDIDPALSHDKHITTLAEFTPSKENERFYYTFDSAVYKLVDRDYVLVEENEGTNGELDTTKEYYHRRFIFTENAEKKPIFFYEKMSAASIDAAVWKEDFETLTHEHTGAYVVPKGTPARELTMYDEQKSTTDNIDTKSAEMVFHPYLSEQNNIVYVDMNLGNNGLLEVTPAQGIKLSKTVDVYEMGTSDNFSFNITVLNEDGSAYTGMLGGYITELDVVPTGDSTKIQLSDSGTYVANLSRNQTLWLTGIPTGATYTIEEVSTNSDYKVKSVHVNGASKGTFATGTVTAHFIDDVDFVNTAVGEGDLVITKKVIDQNNNEVDISDDITFTAEVTLTDASGVPINDTFNATTGTVTTSSEGKFTVTLKEGESFVVRGLDEGTRYSVVETIIPDGFTFNADESSMEGIIDATGNDQALIVNNYVPQGTDGENVTVNITKQISGNRTTWLNGESYSFEVKRISSSGAVLGTVGSFTIGNDDADKKYSLTLSSEDYLNAGTYHYIISELSGGQKGITYDTADRRFAVVVADFDMDGDLEITAVNNEANTTVTKSGNEYTVAANFNNIYQPTDSSTVEINVVKKMDGNYSLSGFQFALYNANPFVDEEADEILRSTVTDALGNAKFTLTYAPNRATMEGAVYTYYLVEINTGNPNIDYDTAVYKVDVTIKDNGDGTTTATPFITQVQDGQIENGNPVFTNKFEPSSSVNIAVTGEKKIKGNRALNDNEFEFIIEAHSSTPNAPLPANKTAKNMANGSIVFDDITFDAAGEYYYTVSELSDNKIGGFDYDDTVYKIKVTVTDLAQTTGERKLIANYELVDTNLTDILFENEYDAEDAKVTLSGTKILTGKTLQDGEFEFVITPTGNTQLPTDFANTVKNVGDAFTFGELTYDKVGTYTYTITEKGTDDENYDYDESIYTVTVTITDNSQGKLLDSVDIKKNGNDSTAIVFNNDFTPTPIDYDIYNEFGGLKTLDGRTLIEDEFEFKLVNATTGAQIGETVHNDADGKVAFLAVEFIDEGEYSFTISEVVGNDKGVTYDTAIYKIFVKVDKNDDGELLVAEQKLYKGAVGKNDFDEITDGSKITFNNSYKADATEIVIKGSKKLEGRDIKADEFSFELYDSDKKKLETVKNTADGKFAFTAIPVEKAGEYVYTVRELNDGQKNVTYDETVYTVTVTVTDNFDGTLKVEYAYSDGDKAAIGIKFVNSYNEPKPEPIPEKEEPSDDVKSPQTGDYSNSWLWFALAFVSGCGILGASIYGKKEETQEK